MSQDPNFLAKTRPEKPLYEVKFDGYRVRVHLRDAGEGLHAPRNDWTNRFRKVAADAWQVNAGSAIIDGELVVPAADGTTDFSVPPASTKARR